MCSGGILQDWKDVDRTESGQGEEQELEIQFGFQVWGAYWASEWRG